ncbi:MAG: co-chaperone DjlA [Gammaproteobacteria bacterium]|nr:co-chaperone DjlA [Gammaproteobacteria bacterium]
MSWWGKILGSTFGFMIGGPIGALLGAALGHNFDKGLELQGGTDGFNPGSQERVQTVFFTASFSVMGAVCKADGQVTKDEIEIARQVMGQMQLSAEQRKAAMALFSEGKQENFPLVDVLEQLRREIGQRHNLKRMFLEIQLYAAFADGSVHDKERALLLKACSILRISQHEFAQMESAIGAQFHHQKGASGQSTALSLEDAYALLNVEESDSTAEIKKAYRRLISQHHPDKLVSKGLPEEMMKIATDRTHEIRQAYEKIKKERNF